MKQLPQVIILVVGGLVMTACSGDTESQNMDSELTAQLNVDIAVKPEQVTMLPYALFEFNAPDGQSYECSLNGDSFEPCASPLNILPVFVGDNELQVRAISSSGLVGASTSYEWQVNSAFGDNVQSFHEDLVPTNVSPDFAEQNSWRGIFRINCDFAHASYDDPIVFPNQDDAAHLHRFYGNTLVDENSTTESLFTSGESSCQGNTLNRSAYWIPALLAPIYDQVTGAAIYDENNELTLQIVPAVVGNDDEAHEIFYYSAGVDDLASIQPIPLGLKMIAGQHSASPSSEQDTSIVRWHCQSWESSDATNPRWSTFIPECIAPDRVRMDVFFPSCWNGVDLDSDDHKSHMAYPVESNSNQMVCPSSHPVPIIRVSFHYAFGVKPDVYHPDTQSSKGWRLASDMYEVTEFEQGGYSLHADWFNAWQPEILETILEHCIKQGLDCHDGNLANGFRLTGTRAGTQQVPAEIKQTSSHH